MSPLSYDPKTTVGGAAATLTMAGLATGLIAGLVQPLYAIIAGVAGVVVAGAFWFIPATSWQPRTIARLGLGLVVGAALSYVLASLGVLPQGALAPR